MSTYLLRFLESYVDAEKELEKIIAQYEEQISASNISNEGSILRRRAALSDESDDSDSTSEDDSRNQQLPKSSSKRKWFCDLTFLLFQFYTFLVSILPASQQPSQLCKEIQNFNSASGTAEISVQAAQVLSEPDDGCLLSDALQNDIIIEGMNTCM